MTKQTIKDDGAIGKYASVIPHMADDDLDPYQMRLYIHYKRLFAEKGGCDESVRETHKITHMSPNKVQEARDQLAELGYIKVEKPTPQEARKGKTVHVTLIDRWSENVSRYAKPVSDMTQQPTEPVSYLTQGVSDITQEAVSNMTRIDLPHPVNTSSSKKESAWYPVIEKVWGYTGGRNRDTEKMLRGVAIKKAYAEYNIEIPLTDPQQLTDWKDWYFKVKNNRAGAVLPGSPEKVQSSIGEYQATLARPKANGNVRSLPIAKAVEPNPEGQQIVREGLQNRKRDINQKLSALAEKMGA